MKKEETEIRFCDTKISSCLPSGGLTIFFCRGARGAGRWIPSFCPSAQQSYRFVFLLPINPPKDNRIPTSSSRRVEEGKRAHCGFPDGGP
jgi:hypothetical protein